MSSNTKAILCLCDDVTMLHVRQLLLEHFGYRVLPTRTIADAENVACENCPDMLLMDSNFPGIDIERVARQLKILCPELVAVVLTPSYAGRNQQHSAVDRFVPRDEGPDVLINQIQELLGPDDEVHRSMVGQAM